MAGPGDARAVVNLVQVMIQFDIRWSEFTVLDWLRQDAPVIDPDMDKMNTIAGQQIQSNASALAVFTSSSSSSSSFGGLIRLSIPIEYTEGEQSPRTGGGGTLQ